MNDAYNEKLRNYSSFGRPIVPLVIETSGVIYDKSLE